MKKFVYGVAAVAMAVTGCGSAYAEAWTLDSCVNYAVEHNINVRQRALELRQSELEVTSAKSQYLPTLNGSASQSWNLGRALTAQNTYADRNTSTTQFGIQLSLPLFDGLQTPRRVAYAKANLSAALEQYESAKDDVTLNVLAAYLQALYAAELHEVALQQVDLSAYELTRQQALLDVGKIPEVDMLEAESQLAQDRLNAATTENDRRLALVELAQILQYPGDIEQFEIVALDMDPHMIAPAAEVYEQARRHNHGVEAARRNIVAAERNITMQKSGWIPRVSFNAGLGTSYYNTSGMNNDSFSRQMRNNYSTYFGFSLNVPIFDAFSTRNAVRRAKVQAVAAQLELDNAELQLWKAVQQAYYQATGAEQKLAASEVADNAASQAFEAMQEKYNIGKATPTEFEQAKTKALRAHTEHIQARYERVLRSRILDFYAKSRL